MLSLAETKTIFNYRITSHCWRMAEPSSRINPAIQKYGKMHWVISKWKKNGPGDPRLTELYYCGRDIRSQIILLILQQNVSLMSTARVFAVTLQTLMHSHQVRHLNNWIITRQKYGDQRISSSLFLRVEVFIIYELLVNGRMSNPSVRTEMETCKGNSSIFNALLSV